MQLEVRRIKSEIADNEKLLSFQSKKLDQSRGLVKGLYQVMILLYIILLGMNGVNYARSREKVSNLGFSTL